MIWLVKDCCGKITEKQHFLDTACQAAKKEQCNCRNMRSNGLDHHEFTAVAFRAALT